MKFLSAIILMVALCCGSALAEGRKAIRNPKPTYPDIAKTMNLRGSVTLELTIAPSGRVMDTRVVGGHPVLAQSAVQTVKGWLFEPAGSTTTETIKIDFN